MIGASISIREEGESAYRLLAFDTASPCMWEYRGAPKRFYFRVAYRGVREQDVGTPSPEQAMGLDGRWRSEGNSWVIIKGAVLHDAKWQVKLCAMRAFWTLSDGHRWCASSALRAI
ncbi:MAG: hypothetical protein RMK92_07805 [Armatimonadota bacterium]|nr:hypothetical protein [Armatimonadota bacterium]